MSLSEFLSAAYAWTDAHAFFLLLLAVAIPPLGALLVRALRTRFPEEARLGANALVALGLLSVVLAAALVAIGLRLLDKGLLELNVLLLVAPVLCLTGALASVRIAFGLREIWLSRELASRVGLGAPPSADASQNSPDAPSPAQPPRRFWGGLVTWAALATVALALGRGQMEPPEEEAPGEPLSLSVADVANETGDKEFDSLSGLIITALEQSQRLEVMSRPAMFDILKQLGRADVARIDEALALEICGRVGIRALVLASLRKFDELYAIDLKVLDPGTRKYLFTAKEEGQGRAAIPRMIDRLSERVRKGLREKQSEIANNQRSVASLASPVMEAYQLFFEAEQHFAQGRPPEAVASYRKALELDPHFAPARLRLSYLAEFDSKHGLNSRQEIQRAMEDLERAPQREQLLIRAWNSHLQGNNEEAAALFARAADEFPTDKMTLYMAGDFHFHRDQHARSLSYLEKVLGLDPLFDYAAAHMAEALTELGDQARADLMWKKALAAHPDFNIAISYALALMRWQRLTEAREVIEKARTIEGFAAHPCLFQLIPLLLTLEDVGGASAMLAQCETNLSALKKLSPGEAVYLPQALALYQGQFGKAAELGRARLSQVKDPRHQENLHLFISLALLSKGQRAAALEEVLRVSEPASPESPPKLVFVLLTLEEFDRARALHAAHPTPEGALRIQIEEAATRGDWETAFSAMGELAAKARKEDKLPNLYWLARLQLRARRPAESLRTIEEARSTWMTNPFAHASLIGRLLMLEAEAQEQLGHRERARALARQLAELWKAGDADAVDLVKARRLLGTR